MAVVSDRQQLYDAKISNLKQQKECSQQQVGLHTVLLNIIHENLLSLLVPVGIRIRVLPNMIIN